MKMTGGFMEELIYSYSQYPKVLLENDIIIAYNQQFKKVVKKSDHDIVKRKITDFISHTLLSKEDHVPKNFYLYFDEVRYCNIIASDGSTIEANISYNIFWKNKNKKIVELTFQPKTFFSEQNPELEKYIQFYKHISEILPDIAFIQKLNLVKNSARFLHVNSIAEEVFGFTLEEIQKIEKENDTAFFDYIHPEDRTNHMQIVENATQRKNIFSRIMKMFTQKGEIKYLYVHSSLFPINEEEVISFGVARDITPMVLHQNKLETQKNLLQSLSRISRDFISTLHIDINDIVKQIVLEINPTFAGIMIYDKKKNENRFATYQISVENLERLTPQLIKIINKNNSSIIKEIPPDIYLEDFNVQEENQIMVIPVKKDKSLIGYILTAFSNNADLSLEEIENYLEQLSTLLSLYLKQIEILNNLEIQYKSFSQILDSIQAGIIVTDLKKGTIYFQNALSQKLFPESNERKNIQQLPIFSFLEPSKATEYYHPTNQKWYKIFCSKISWLDMGNMDLIIFVDVTDLKETVKKLQNSNTLFETLVNNTPVGIIHMDIKGNLLYINDTYLNILNLSVEHITQLKKSFSSLFELPSLKKVGLVDKLHEVIATGEKFEGSMWIESITGQEKYMHYIIVPLKDENGDVSSIIWVGQDLTEMQILQEEKNRTNLLNSIGMLAAGVAHDFNNLLTGIIGNLSLARELIKLNNIDRLQKVLLGAEIAAEKSRELTYQLLSFAKGGVPNLKIIDVNKLIKNITKLLVSGTGINLHFELNANKSTIRMDSIQFEQIINNLVTNAIQAMHNKGDLYVKTNNVHVKKENPLLLEEGEYVVIQVKDTGIGINKKDLSKIFDPFFSTKKRGSGLGLSTVYSIIKKHGGNILVNSQSGKGTTFTVYLPYMEGTPEPEGKEEKSDMTLEELKNLKILFLDDEEYIRKMVVEFFSELKHKVVTVSTGEEAIMIYEEHYKNNDPFDIIILDLTIKGGMDGVEAFQHIKQINPNVKAILATGYADQKFIKKFSELGFTSILQKPFAFDNLIQIIQKSLK